MPIHRVGYVPQPLVERRVTPDTRTLGNILRIAAQQEAEQAQLRAQNSGRMWATFGDLFQRFQQGRQAKAMQAEALGQRDIERAAAEKLKRDEMQARADERADAQRIRQRGEDRDAAVYTAESLAPGPVDRFAAEILSKFPGTAARVKARQTLPATVTPGALGEVSPELEAFSVLEPTPAQTAQAQAVGRAEAAARAAEAARLRDDERMSAAQKEAARHNAAMERAAAATNARLSGPKPPSDQRIDRIGNNFKTESVVKKAQTMAEAVDFVKSLDPKTVNPSDDQALIYAFAKVMDPESVVREGEYATVQKYSQSLAEKYGFDAKRVFSNTVFLTPEARQNMKATIETRFEPVRKQYNNLRKSYVERLNKVTGGADGEDYLNDYGAAFPEPTPQKTADPIDALIKKYGGG